MSGLPKNNGSPVLVRFSIIKQLYQTVVQADAPDFFIGKIFYIRLTDSCYKFKIVTCLKEKNIVEFCI